MPSCQDSFSHLHQIVFTTAGCLAPIAILLLLDAKADRDTQESQICLSATRFLKQIARFGELVFYGNFGTMHRKTQPTFDEATTELIEANKDQG